MRVTLKHTVLCLALTAASLHAAVPPRIVSTSPSITETLFALGLGERVVGVSEFCRFPPEVVKLPKVGTYLKPDVERIAGLRPDLVIVSAVSSDLERRMATLKIPFLVVERGSTTSVFETIRQIGSATGVPERAETLVRDLEARLDRVRRGAAAPPRRRVLFIIGRSAGALTDLVAVGRDPYLNNLIDIAGGTNVMAIAGMPEYPRISMETVLRLDPDVIIDTVDMGDTDTERRARQVTNARLWAAYPRLTAVKSHRLYTETTDPLVVPGPRIVEAAEWLAARLRGEPPR